MVSEKSKNSGDLGGRERLEDELKEYQAKFRALFDNVSSGVAVYEARNEGEDFVFVDFNTAGYTQ
jgi:hypothetical protein